MTREGLNKHWAVVEAFKNGATIEYRNAQGGWEVTTLPGFFEKYEYRIKREPRKLYSVYRDGRHLISYEKRENSERYANGIPGKTEIVEYTESSI